MLRGEKPEGRHEQAKGESVVAPHNTGLLCCGAVVCLALLVLMHLIGGLLSFDRNLPVS